MADRCVILIVAALLLVLAIVVFITALGDYLFQPMSVYWWTSHLVSAIAGGNARGRHAAFAKSWRREWSFRPRYLNLPSTGRAAPCALGRCIDARGPRCAHGDARRCRPNHHACL